MQDAGERASFPPIQRRSGRAKKVCPIYGRGGPRAERQNGRTESGRAPSPLVLSGHQDGTADSRPAASITSRPFIFQFTARRATPEHERMLPVTAR